MGVRVIIKIIKLVLKIYAKFICKLIKTAYNVFMSTNGQSRKTQKTNKVEVNTMSNITLNSNRAKAAIFIAHRVVQTKKPVTDETIKDAAERYMVNHNPGPAVVEVIKAEVKRLLGVSKGKVTNLPPIPAELGAAAVVKKPAPAVEAKPAPAKKGAKAAKADTVTSNRPKRKLATATAKK